ncbi:MAG TPA: MFS transporter [Nitrospiria bacterium]|nr:MFS transporter [Nitrospiria bacterium]
MSEPRRALFSLPRTVVMLGVVSLLTDASSEMIYPLLPIFLATTLGAGATVIGLIEGVAESTASLVKLGSGWWSDRLGRRKAIVVAGYTLSACARPLVALAGAGWHVLVIRFADRVGKGLRSAPRDALLAASTPAQSWGKAFGFHRAMDHTGAIIGPLIATALLAWGLTDLRVLFALAAIPGILAVVVLVSAVREHAPVDRAAAAPPRLSLAPFSPRFRAVLGVVALFTLGNSSDAFLLLKANAAGIGPAWIPLLWILLHITKAASSTPAGTLSDRIGRPRLILAGWLVYAAVYAGFGLATAAWQIWALFAIYGLFFGLTEGVEKAYVADLAPAEHRGTAYGLYHVAVGLAALPASVMMGVVWEHVGPGAAFGLGAGLALLASLLFLAALRVPSRT